MKRSLVLVLAALLSALTVAVAPRAEACQPCSTDHTLDLEQSVQNAAAIVIGRRVVQSDDRDGEPMQPADFTFQVDEVLAGALPDDARTIKVRTWYGMCPYGIFIQPDEADRDFVLLLSEHRNDAGAWSPVSTCGVKILAVDDEGHVELDGERVARSELADAFARLRPPAADDDDDDDDDAQDAE